MMEVLISLDRYLKERVDLLLSMDDARERHIRLDELNKFLTHFFTQLQKAKEKLENENGTAT